MKEIPSMQQIFPGSGNLIYRFFSRSDQEQTRRVNAFPERPLLLEMFIAVTEHSRAGAGRGVMGAFGELKYFVTIRRVTLSYIILESEVFGNCKMCDIGTTLIGSICDWSTFFYITLRNWDIYSESVHLLILFLNT